MDKVLSIIIPSYNMEKYLGRCIDSILIPNLDLLDIIIINDGSTDNTFKIGCAYEKRYPNSIRCINKQNGNYGSCINTALKVAKGKFIRILDADDSYNTVMLDEFVRRIKSIEVDCIITNFDIVNSDGSIRRKVRYQRLKPYKIIPMEENYEYIAKTISMHAVTFRTELLRELNYSQTEGISYTDSEWVYTPIAFSKTCIYYPFNIYTYLLGREGQTMDPVVLKKRYHHLTTIIEHKTQLALLYQTNISVNSNYLLLRLKSMIITNLYFALFSSEELKDIFRALYLKNKNNWKELGINMNSLTRLPIIKYSTFKGWEEHGLSNSYVPPKFVKFYRMTHRIISHIYILLYN